MGISMVIVWEWCVNIYIYIYIYAHIYKTKTSRWYEKNNKREK